LIIAPSSQTLSTQISWVYIDWMQRLRQNTQQQLQSRKSHGLLVGFHHGVLNPLLSMWGYPKRMNLIQMITFYQMGSPMESVPPLKYIATKQVSHFYKDGACIS